MPDEGVFLSSGIIILLISFHVPFVVKDVVKGKFIREKVSVCYEFARGKN